jgi:prepilin-type N-terminal cleavage/methylation domain-containing protein
MISLFRSRAINRIEQGFTLVEILIAIAIVAIIGSAVAVTTFQVFNVNAASTNRQITITQVENAVHYVSRDAQQAQHIIPKDSADVALPMDAVSKEIAFDLINGFIIGTGDKLTLEWIAWDNTRNEVTYTVVDGALQKTTIINNGVPEVRPVADNISVASGNWNPEQKVLTLEIKATVGTGTSLREETRTFQIIPRSAQ